MKHKEIIKAWLDGATVEYIIGGKEVITLPSAASQNRVDFMFNDNAEYRIKPGSVNYRVALFRHDHAIVDLQDLKIIYEFDFIKMNNTPKFIRWASDVLSFEP